MQLFFIDTNRNLTKTYEEFISDLNEKNYVRERVLLNRPYELFLEVIHSIILGNEIEIIDFNTMKKLGEDAFDFDSFQKRHIVKKIRVNNFDDLIEKLNEKKDSFSITCYTKGTCGRPKRVRHSLNTFINNEKTTSRKAKNIWALACNPTHYAGLEILFRALFDRMPILYIFDCPKEKVESYLHKYHVNNLASTPSFFRNLIPFMTSPLESIEEVSIGWERLDPMIITALQASFPNTKVTTLYGLTEAGVLLSSSGEFFELLEEVREIVQISEEKELMIHKSMIGEIEEELKGDWYYSGDIVEFVQENKLRVIGKKQKLIKIGVNYINPAEIEEEILKVDGVTDVMVKGKEDNYGTIAEVFLVRGKKEEEMKETILTQLLLNLQEWKIPSEIIFHQTIKN